MKTIEQIALEKYPFRIDGASVALRNVFKGGVEFAQRWIPIEEEHPDLDILGMLVDPVIFKGTDGLVYVTYMSFDFTKITHWRPIELK